MPTGGWLVLTGGAPVRPQSANDFLDRFYAEFCGLESLPLHVTDKQVVPRESRTARGFCGSDQCGYRFVEEECLETKVVPYSVKVETYGVPGVELDWEYCWEYAGQYGYSDFQHIRLRAVFGDSGARNRFDDLWQKVFGRRPTWAATDWPAPPSVKATPQAPIQKDVIDRPASIVRPVLPLSVPEDVLRALERHFHALIRERAGSLIDQHQVPLPELARTLATPARRAYFGIPGMYGGFAYWLEGDGAQVRLITESRSRVFAGKGQRHEVTVDGSRLMATGIDL